jgi:hypothetical protein
MRAMWRGLRTRLDDSVLPSRTPTGKTTFANTNLISSRVTTDDAHYLIETKGREDVDVANKERAAILWFENATCLTGTRWQYLKVLPQDYKRLQPDEFADLLVFVQRSSA